MCYIEVTAVLYSLSLSSMKTKTNMYIQVKKVMAATIEQITDIRVNRELCISFYNM